MITLAAHASIAEATQQLTTSSVSCTLTCLRIPSAHPELTVPTGLITERDIVQLQGLGLDLYTMQVSDVANFPLHTIAADGTLWEAHERMMTLGIRWLVIRDPAGKLAGLITPAHVLQALNSSELYATVQTLRHTLNQDQDAQQNSPTRETPAPQKTQADVTEPQTIPVIGLRASHTFSDTILDTTSSPIMVLDAQGRIVRFNRACEQLTGYSAQAMLGQDPWEKLLPAAERATEQQALQALLERSPPTPSAPDPGSPRVCEQIWQTRTGQQRIIRREFAVLQDPAGVPVYVICTGIDETERRQAERAQQASETAYRELATQLEARVAERTCTLDETNARLEQAIAAGQRRADALQATQTQLQFLLTASPAVLYRCRAVPPFNAITISDNFERIFGYSMQQCADLPSLWADNVHPEDHTTTFAAANSVLGDPTTVIHRQEYRFRHADGTYHWVHDEFRILRDDTGQPVELVGYCIDIGSRKRAEQQLQTTSATLRALLDAIPESIFAINAAGTICHVNATAAQRLESSPDQLMGTCLYDAFAPDVAALRRARNDRVFATGQPLHCHDCRDHRIFETWVYPIWGDRAQVERVAIFSQDVTERWQIAQALQDSERRFRAIFEQADAGIVLVSLQGRFLLTNQKFQDWLGYSAATLQTMTIMDLIHPADRAHSAAILAQATRAPSRSFHLEKRYLRRDGTVVWGYLSGAVVVDDHGQADYLVGFGFDVSDRQRTAAHLQQQTSTLLAAERIAHIGHWSFDRRTKAITWSEEIFRIFGRNPNAGPPSYEELHQAIHLEDREHYRQSVEAILGAESNFRVEFWVLHPHGEVRHLEARGQSTCDKTGQVTRLFGMVVDITERKKADMALRASEYLHRTLLEHMSAVVYVTPLTDPHIPTYISPQIETLLGYSPQDWLNQPNFWVDRLHPDDRERVLATLKHSCAQQTPFLAEYRILHRDGRMMWLRDSAAVLGDLQGNPLYLQGVLLDISDRKLAQLALEDANTQLAKSLADLERNHRDLVALGQLMEVLQACSTLQEVGNTIPAFLRRLFPDCAGGIFWNQPESQTVQKIATFGELTATEIQFPLDSCRAVRQERPDVMEPNPVDSCCPQLLTELEGSSQTRCVPMTVRGRVLGVLYLRSPHAAWFDATAQQFARTAAEQIALVLSNLQLRQRLREDSIRDPLTGLYNRRYLEEFLVRELARAARSHQSLSVWMIDIDHFKQFNDHFGHAAGDQVLRAISRLLKQHVRTSDIACRYGGEELLAILPHIDSTTAHHRAEEFRQAVAALTLQYQAQDLGHIAVSLGIANYQDHGETAITLLRQADTALYQAKSTGRNRVVVASPTIDFPTPAG